jgi:hypothetical protein
MNEHEAADRIELICTVLARQETFWGYRPVAVAATGVIGLAGAMVQPLVIADGNSRPESFVAWWVGLALVSIVCVGLQLIRELRRDSELLRQQLWWRAVMQFAPTLMLGGVITVAAVVISAPAIEVLPGLWALLFAGGIIASRPYLVPCISLMAGYYGVAGMIGLLAVDYQLSFSPWYMGSVFGVGQCLTAIMLYRAGGRHGQSAWG